jgi:hypothetical protein
MDSLVSNDIFESLSRSIPPRLELILKETDDHPGRNKLLITICVDSDGLRILYLSR